MSTIIGLVSTFRLPLHSPKLKLQFSIIPLPLTPSATKVPNLPTNIPSVYAGFQNHNN